MKEKNLYIIAGCNGAGKTTASFTILPDILDCKEFVNADEIARGLSPFQPNKVSFEAGRIMLNRIEELFRDNQSFAFETTLATKCYKNKIIEAKKNGYEVTMLFFWLNNIDLAIERVATRVQEGGHNIPTDVIIRRYKRGICNLFDIYMPIVDEYMIIDNSDGNRDLIINKLKNNNIEIYDEVIYERIKRQKNEFSAS